MVQRQSVQVLDTIIFKIYSSDSSNVVQLFKSIREKASFQTVLQNQYHTDTKPWKTQQPKENYRQISLMNLKDSTVISDKNLLIETRNISST